MDGAQEGFTHKQIAVSDGVRLHCASAGQNGGKRPLVILLHGFPEFWWSWRHQMKALAAAGYHVVAPDLRGYNASDKPRPISAYRIDRLAEDVADLVRAHGAEKAFVVGHDWGGGVAWQFAMHHPQMLERLAILNSPHPVMMLKGLRSPRQMRKSWYIFFFQLPRLPERFVKRNGYDMIRRTLREAMNEEEISRYIDAASKPGALTAMINYYRAMMRTAIRGGARKARPIEQPVMVVWGERDRYLGRDIARPPSPLVPNLRMEWLPEASHWVQNDSPARVNELLVDFFGAARDAKRRAPASSA